MNQRVNETIIDLDKQELDLLAWLSEWTPAVAKAHWEVRRSWPPGFRYIRDMSVDYRDSAKVAEAKKEMSVSPGRDDAGRADRLLGYRLIEGYHRTMRLTRRGRAALKHYGRECVDSFKSHAPDVFDDVDLRPLVSRGVFDLDNTEANRKYKYGDLLPDTAEIWKMLLIEYREDDYRGKGTLTNASATLTTPSSTGTYLNGSMREHNHFICLTISNGDGKEVLSLAMSPEQLADLLTSNGSVPVTLENYYGPDGMWYGEPAPEPVSPMDRMYARLEGTQDRTTNQVKEIMAKVEAANIGVKMKAELLHDLKVVLNCGNSGYAFAAQQAVEEMSMAVESAVSIARDRMVLAGMDTKALDAQSVMRSLPPPKEKKEGEDGNG